MSTENRDRAWVDVSASALRENLQKIQDTVGGEVSMLPMVKADAYGLGMAETVHALKPLDPWGYGVAAVGEGLALRRLGVKKPVLVCSPIAPGSYEAAVEGGLSVSISGLAGLASLEKAVAATAKSGGFHLEIDTGMGRAGIDWRQVDEWGPVVCGSAGSESGSGLVWEGCFTHFHSADGADAAPTEIQWDRLLSTVDRLPARTPGMKVHACNSPGSLRRPEFAGSIVRPGIFLYGGVAGDALPPPSPVAALRARIVHIKEARAHDTVGYGATYSAQGPERWATAAIGYGDGLPRLLSNRGEGVVRGRRVPIIGRISMDVTVLDVSGVPDAELGDVVTFFGRSDGDEIGLEEVAGHAGTINYEILTGLTRRLPRIWTDDGGY